MKTILYTVGISLSMFLMAHSMEDGPSSTPSSMQDNLPWIESFSRSGNFTLCRTSKHLIVFNNLNKVVLRIKSHQGLHTFSDDERYVVPRNSGSTRYSIPE